MVPSLTKSWNSGTSLQACNDAFMMCFVDLEKDYDHVPQSNLVYTLGRKSITFSVGCWCPLGLCLVSNSDDSMIFVLWAES